MVQIQVLVRCLVYCCYFNELTRFNAAVDEVQEGAEWRSKKRNL
jgi:hypothetical protein